MEPRPALQHPPREQPAALERLDRSVAGDEHAVAGRPVRAARREAVALQRLQLARAVLGLLRRGRDAQRADAPHDRRAQLGREPVELDQRLRVDAGRALVPPLLHRRVVELRAAGEQEAAVAAGGAAGDRPGVDPDDGRAGVQRRADRGQARSAEADDAQVGARLARERRRVLPGGRVAPDGCGGAHGPGSNQRSG
jgi:hypothetical protein